jgi:hypothetical protein
MFGRGPRKKWHEMTRGDIVATLTAFTIIGGAVVAGCVRSLFVIGEFGIMWLIPAAGILFVAAGVGVTWIQAIRELRRRRKDDS